MAAERAAPGDADVADQPEGADDALVRIAVSHGVLTRCCAGGGDPRLVFHTEDRTWIVDGGGHATLVQSSVRDLLGPVFAEGRIDVPAALVQDRGGGLVVRA